jgi:hypothetical protein
VLVTGVFGWKEKGRCYREREKEKEKLTRMRVELHLKGYREREVKSEEQ